MMKVKLFVLAVTVAVAGACASTPVPYKQPVKVTPPSGRVMVSESLTIFDASGSLEANFADGKATLESLISAMPSGNYSAGNIHFGGTKREASGLSGFDRSSLGAFAKSATFLEGTTPIFDVIGTDAAAAIGNGSGRAAVILISDGLATDYAGRGDADAMTVEAAQALVASRSGETCFHTIQSGDSAAGSALLQQIANVSSCGSFRNASALASASALQSFSREVYMGNAPAPKPVKRRVVPAATAVDGDADADGVADSMDRCPNTLRQARVDSRGCWTLSDLRFAVNGAEIESGFEVRLREDIAVLAANPGVRIRVDGHTDSDGSEAYNKSLSGRRAESVRDFFVKDGGLDASRFETMGFGESQPIAANDSRANKRRNRRVELTILE